MTYCLGRGDILLSRDHLGREGRGTGRRCRKGRLRPRALSPTQKSCCHCLGPAGAHVARRPRRAQPEAFSCGTTAPRPPGTCLAAWTWEGLGMAH